MEEGAGAKQSEIVQLLQELKEQGEAKKKKPWVLTEGRAQNFAKAAAKRRENIEKRKREAEEKAAFEAERKAFYEMAAKNPTGHVVQAPPVLAVNAAAPSAPIPAPVTVQAPPAAPVAEPAAPPQVRFVEKPIMADEVEDVNHENDHDDGWMTNAGASRAREQVVGEAAPLTRQTNTPAVVADWAEGQMAAMSRKRMLDESPPEPIAPPTHRIGTGAGNHAPYEGDPEYVEPWRRDAIGSNRYMVSPEEALQLLAMPKDVALRYLASRVAQGQRAPPYYEPEMVDMEPEPTASSFLSHTRHYSQRHPSQLHNSTNSVRYGAPTGDNFLWL